jgi:hypothetical protein
LNHRVGPPNLSDSLPYPESFPAAMIPVTAGL